MFIKFVENGGNDPDEFLKFIEKPIEIRSHRR